MSSFKVHTDAFKKVLQFIKVLVPQKENSIIFEITDGGRVIIQCGTQGIWLEQVLEATEVSSEGPQSFSVPLDVLQKFKYPGKEIFFELKAGAKKNSTPKVSLTSGRFKGLTLCTNPEKVLVHRLQKTELAHSLDCATFATGLKLLSFKPVDLASQSKIVRMNIQDKKLVLTTNDDFRGGIFSADMEAENMGEATIDFSFIMAALSLLNDPVLQIGFTQKQIRVKCGMIDLECQLQFIGGSPADIFSRINAFQQQTSSCTFDLSAKELKNAISAISNVGAKEEEIRIYIEVIKGKEIKKTPEDKDTLKIYTKGTSVFSAYHLPVDNLEGIGGKFSVSSKLIKPLLLMDNFIRLYFYDRVLIIECFSDKYTLKFMLPQLAVEKES